MKTIFRHCQKSRTQEREQCARFALTYADPAHNAPLVKYFFGNKSLFQSNAFLRENPALRRIKSRFVSHMCEHCDRWHKGEAWQ